MSERASTVFVPCIGAHYTNVVLAVGFNPSAPSELLFEGTRPDSRIVGLSYLVYHPGGAPEGFAGPNDHWHQHTFNGGLCIAAGGIAAAGQEDVDSCTSNGWRGVVAAHFYHNSRAGTLNRVACRAGRIRGE